MTLNLDRGLRSTASHAALSAGIAFSLTGMVDDASAQQRSGASSQNPSQNVALDPINVDAQSASGNGEGSYTPVTTASSPKQTSSLLNTPQTVTVIPQAIIREQGATNLTEVLRNTPGITFDAGENGFATSTNNFKIRGFDSSGSVFIDGSRDNGSYTRDIFNIERVEVFKGAAADNGRGSGGGYVNMVTKTPHLRNFSSGEVSIGFDEYNSKVRKRVTTDLNYVIAPNTAFRLNALVEDSGIPGRELGVNQPWGFAPSLAYGLGTDFRAIFAYEHVSRRDRPDWGVPAATIPGLITYNPLTQGARRDAYYGLRSDFDNTDSDVALARFEYDLAKNVTISNQTRWSQVDRTSRFTTVTNAGASVGSFLPPNTVPTQTLFYDRMNTTLTNLTNLSAEFYTGSFKHNISTGLEFSREDSTANRFGSIAGATTLFSPDPDRAAGAPFVPTQRAGASINTVAGYLYDTIELNRQWQVVGGLRVEHYAANLDSKTIAGAPVSGGAVDGFNTTQTTLSGKVGVVYKPVDQGSLYATFGVSHLPPGSYLSNADISRTGSATDDQAFPGFVAGADPVRFHNYEVGVKWNFFNDRLTTAASLFRTEKRNAPITGLDVGQAGVATLKGYGQQIVQGIEFGVAGKITEDWQVFGGLLLMDSERKHSAYLDDVRRRATPGDFTPAYVTTNGDQLAFTPNVSGNIWTTYRLPFGLTVGGGVQYVGSSYLGRPDDATRIIPNGKFGKLPAYTVVNLMASYEVRPGVDLRFNVDNVADTKYVVSTNWAATRAAFGTSRAYRISTSFKF